MQEFSQPYSSYVTSARLLQKYQELERDIHYITGYTLVQLKDLFAMGFELKPPKYDDISLSKLGEIFTEKNGFIEV